MTDLDAIRAQLPDDLAAEVVGSYSFGDSDELRTELTGLVLHGPKRATAGAVDDLDPDEPTPAAGQLWAVEHPLGTVACVVRTTWTTVGPLASVTTAFAWDEGEGDRSREDWLDGHRRYFVRNGVEDPDALETLFERFEVVWPDPDAGPRAWGDDVTELGIDDRDEVVAALGLPPDLPALVTGDRTAALAFEPLPDAVRIVALVGAPDHHARLRDAVSRLAAAHDRPVTDA